jgi:hypothetical protein
MEVASISSVDGIGTDDSCLNSGAVALTGLAPWYEYDGKPKKNRLMLGVNESNSATSMRCFRTTTDENKNCSTSQAPNIKHTPNIQVTMV